MHSARQMRTSPGPQNDQSAAKSNTFDRRAVTSHLAQLTADMQASPQLNEHRRHINLINQSAQLIAQREMGDLMNSSPRVFAPNARQTNDNPVQRVAQLYRVGYVPDLTGLTVPGGGLGAYDYDAFARPTGWYDGTQDRLFARSETHTVEVLGQTITLVRCSVTNRLESYAAMQIGHVNGWRDYVREKQPATVREATNAYNDLANLRFESAPANASHDYEAGRDSDADDSDGEGGMDEDEDMDPVARSALDDYLAGREMVLPPHPLDAGRR